MMIGKVYINADGGSRKNPGPAAIGIVIRDEKDNIIDSYKERIGECTSNVAEYKSLIKALEVAAKHTRNELYILMDSELVIRQVNGVYKIKAQHLVPLSQEVKKREQCFKKVVYKSVTRNNKYQQKADQLVNKALDGR